MIRSETRCKTTKSGGGGDDETPHRTPDSAATAAAAAAETGEARSRRTERDDSRRPRRTPMGSPGVPAAAAVSENSSGGPRPGRDTVIVIYYYVVFISLSYARMITRRRGRRRLSSFSRETPGGRSRDVRPDQLIRAGARNPTSRRRWPKNNTQPYPGRSAEKGPSSKTPFGKTRRFKIKNEFISLLFSLYTFCLIYFY